MIPGKWPIFGHEWAVETLARDLAQQRPRHAYLITGPAGIGKRTLARAFAQTALCSQAAPPCGLCRACKLVANDRHPDVSILEPEISGRIIKTAKITIAPVRQLIRDFALRPVEAARRLAILADFEAANPAAANALLKTLEEPPGDSLLVLTATSADALLPTIVSRCERIALRPLPRKTIAAALGERWQAAPEQAALLASISGGRLGWAVRMLTEQAALERRTEHLVHLDELLRNSNVERFAFAERLSKDREALQEALETWQGWWRDVYLTGSGAASPIANVDFASEIQAVAGRVEPAAAANVVNAIRGTLSALARNANARLALEVLLLQLPFLAS
ncbi:MAG: DNA polymerase III subunit delta' [Anaerolineales bacterium]